VALDLYQVSVKAIIRREDGRVLGLNGRVGGAFEGFYDIPGGRIEESEFAVPFHVVIQREVAEELGPNIRFRLSDAPVAVGRHQSKQGQRVLYVFFEGVIDTADVALEVSHEHVGWAWLDVSTASLEKLFVSGILEGMKQWYTARHET